MTDRDAIENLKNYIESLIEDYGYHKDIVEFRDSIEHLEKSIQTQQEEIERLQKIELKSKGGGIKVTLEGLLEMENKILDLEAKIEKLKMKLAQNCARTLNSDLELKHKHKEDLEALNLGWKAELEKKQALINTMQAEFERLEDLEDNTDMLKEELKKKHKIINNSINEIEKIRQYFSEDLQVEFIRILEILKDKKVIDW